MFHSITPDEQQAHIAAAIISREQEIFFYQLNIANYTAALATLPQGEWPANIAQYRGQQHIQLAGLDDATHAQIAEYMHRDQIAFLIRTEKIEMAKSQKICDALIAQLPVADIPALIAKAKGLPAPTAPAASVEAAPAAVETQSQPTAVQPVAKPVQRRVDPVAAAAAQAKK